MKDREQTTHPSFGQISFSRIQSLGTDFYGSELKQNNYIQLTVLHSEIDRDLSSDRYFGGDRGNQVLKLRMSCGQFSELVTSMNMGDGVPCTLEVIDGKRVEELPVQESRKEFVHRKFKDRMKQFSSGLIESNKEAKKIIAKKTLSANDQKTLENIIRMAIQEISSNIPFFAEMFQETADKVVNEAKLEVENAIMHKITTLGLTELHKQQRVILDSNPLTLLQSTNDLEDK